ncbi:MAG TPA: LON peptidase substrate-binding domain-containing protein [Candidatus Acidoferrales bacterium]|nr:LON peptidase substrate-binding domain-containing protein [Candidatus Acidoferrales bacterium]
MANLRAAPQSLPEILPVFPLTGVLLFPGMILPLHIFEPRYRNMVEDALKSDGVFGMIQPVVPRQDNRPLPGAERETPELYTIGCAGYIEQWERLPDGRFVLHLRGLSRFRVERELPLVRGYRRVKASYTAFADFPIDRSWRCDRSRLMAALEGYAKTHGLGLQLEQAGELSDLELVSIVGMTLPFHPAEKQALLEAPSPDDREAVLLDLLRLGSAAVSAEPSAPPRTLH